MAPVEISEQELMGSEALVPDAPIARADPRGLLSVYASVSDFQQLPLPEIIDVEEKRVSRAALGCGCRRRTLLAAALTVCLVATTACLSLLPSHALTQQQQQMLQWPSAIVQEFQTEPVTEPLLDESNSCARMESNVAYLYPRRVENFVERIPEQKTCCRFCHNEPRCKSWTWIQKTGRCYFMDMLPLKKVTKAGYHSG